MTSLLVHSISHLSSRVVRKQGVWNMNLWVIRISPKTRKAWKLWILSHHKMLLFLILWEEMFLKKKNSKNLVLAIHWFGYFVKVEKRSILDDYKCGDISRGKLPLKNSCQGHFLSTSEWKSAFLVFTSIS